VTRITDQHDWYSFCHGRAANNQTYPHIRVAWWKRANNPLLYSDRRYWRRMARTGARKTEATR
jgi:hypothetical protein